MLCNSILLNFQARSKISQIINCIHTVVNREGYAEHYNQDADFFSVSQGKVTIEGFFYWNLSSEACAGHAKPSQ